MTNGTDKHPYWTRDEFMAFLLLYCAGVDMDCTEEERKVIRDGIDDAHLAAVEAEYDRLSDFGRISVMKSYQPLYFKDPAQKEDLMKAIRMMFTADGDFDTMEHNVYLMLQKIL